MTSLNSARAGGQRDVADDAASQARVMRGVLSLVGDGRFERCSHLMGQFELSSRAAKAESKFSDENKASDVRTASSRLSCTDAPSPSLVN